MRLIIARSNFFSYSETFIEEQIKQLEPIHVLYEGWQPSRLKAGGSIYPLPFSILAVRGVLRRIIPGLYQKIYTYYLRRFIRASKADAFLANYGPLGTNIYEACLAEGIPYSVVFLGFDAAEKKTLATYGARYAISLPRAKAIICVAESMRSTLEEIAGPLPNLHVIPCGVDTARFTPGTAKDGFNVISVARFAEKKGSLKSIQAFEILLRDFPNAQLRMVGDGPLWEEAKAYVSTHGLSDNIHFLGAMGQSDYLPLLQESNVFIQHSVLTPSGDSEGTPVAILEASACGLAICSTRHAGIPDAVIEGKTGLLVDEHDVEGMASALKSLASDSVATRAYGAAARKHMEEQYDVVKLSAKIKGLLV
ncbi:MAG: putative colanic acid biosynthesis glycosyltransferase WcaL [Bacteroidota bacterium]|jgi:colanic acid/amylovoran biosynthesis glycosyltransferase